MNLEFLLNLFFPKFCLGCKAEGTYLCEQCFKSFNMCLNQRCARCGKVTGNGKFCSRICANGFGFDQLIICMDYKKTPLLKKIISNYKYHFLKELSGCLIEMMKFEIQRLNIEEYLIVPVPLHKKRMRYRGFNQSLLLANGLGVDNVCDCIKRISYNNNQAKLNRAGRLENLKNNFKVNKNLCGRKVLLIDDVATTCSTLNECSKALKNAGAKEVCGLVLARVW